MKIGLFSDRYLPHTDGVTYSIISFRTELEKLGHEVYVVAPAEGLRVTETDPYVIRFPAVKGLFFDDYSTSLFFPPQIIKRLDKLGLDLIHYQTPSQVGMLGAYYAVRRNLPLVTTYHTDLFEYVTHYPSVLPGIIALSMLAPVITGGTSMDEFRTGMSAMRPERSIDKWNQRIVERGVTMIHNHCDLVIAPSEKMAMQLRDWKTTAPIEILPTGIDELITTEEDIKQACLAYDIEVDDQVVLFVGRIGGEKNIELLVRAFALVADSHPSAKLLFIGEGPERHDMIELVRQLALTGRVSLPGQVARHDLGAIYGLATVFAFPSMADTQGLVVNEAALAGLPLVMIDPHVSEIMRQDETGLFAKPTAKDLAAQITTLLDNPELRERLGQAGRQIALGFSSQTQARKLSDLYDHVIKQRQRNNNNGDA